MVVATSWPDTYDEGYPRSSEADLDPGPDLSGSLDDADLVASDEHRVVPGHHRHEAPPDADDADDAETGD